MKARLILKALFKFRNIGVLLLLLGVSAGITGNMFGYNIPEIIDMAVFPASAGVYAVLVMQTLLSKKFHEDFNKSEKVRSIQDLNYACLKLSNEVKRNTNSTYLQKMKKVMEDKNDIVESYFRGERSFLKEKITEQTLNLVYSYLKLLNNFCIRSRELSVVDVGAVANRINTNTRKMGFTKDINMVDELQKTIDMDEKLINRLKDEKKELERIGAKLDYMETTVNLFKHQAISSAESEEMLEKLETAVNEAEALDNVLEDRRKSKVRRI